jgi:uncharacterized damage-inducible protein DinB
MSNSATFTTSGVLTLHRAMHESLDIVFAHAATFPPEQLKRDVPGFGRGCVHDQLIHIVAVESRWVGRLQNVSLDPFDASAYTTLTSIEDARTQVMEHTVAYITALGDVALDRVLPERPREWIGPLRSPGFILHHIITHTFHHKGQIASMFRLLGAPIGDTDLQRE